MLDDKEQQIFLNARPLHKGNVNDSPQLHIFLYLYIGNIIIFNSAYILLDWLLARD